MPARTSSAQVAATLRALAVSALAVALAAPGGSAATGGGGGGAAPAGAVDAVSLAAQFVARLEDERSRLDLLSGALAALSAHGGRAQAYTLTQILGALDELHAPTATVVPGVARRVRSFIASLDE